MLPGLRCSLSVQYVLSECLASIIESHDFQTDLTDVFVLTPSKGSSTLYIDGSKMIRISGHGERYLQ